jgi:electron transport complex protein RnfA
MFTTILLVIITAALSQNFILAKFLGICPFLGVSKRTSNAFSMGVAVTLVMLLATLVTYPLYTYVMVPLKIEYLYIIFFIFIIAALVQMLEKIIAKLSPKIYSAMGVYLPLITTNCAILGVAKLVLVSDLGEIVKGVTDISMNLGFALLYALAAGIGFTLAMVLMGGVRERIEKLPVAKCMKGFPITMVAASLMAMAFYVFTLIKF